MSNGSDLGTSSSAGGNFVYGGLANNVNAFDLGTNTAQLNAFNTYGGTANNQAGIQANNSSIASSNTFNSYGGYNAAYGGVIAITNPVIPNVNTVTTQMDNLPVLTWPKDQQVYYKLVGFNTNTQTFETWIIAENIVPRTETFDPTKNFPNIDFGVYFTPPSGNTLVNIKIVGRWIQ